jgi:phage I-like protein
LRNYGELLRTRNGLRRGTVLALVMNAPAGTPINMATAMNRSKVRPAKDEWGVYDPQQAGLAALFAKLDARDPKAAPAPSATPAAKPAESKVAALSALPPIRDAK